jgi:type IV fimbrial biogenesis protein FimT
MDMLYGRNKLQASSAGFTLMEVLVVLTLMAILAALAFPAFRGFTRSSLAVSTANDFVSAANLARSEAVTRAVPVTVCKSSDQASCATGVDWDVGWIVFADEDADATLDAGDDELLRVYTPHGGNVEMTGGADSVTYLATGFFAPGSSSATIVVDADGKQVNIDISANGRVSTEKQ